MSMHIISYSNYTEIQGVNCKSRYAGSGSYRCDGDLIYSRTHHPYGFEIKGNIYKNYLETATYCGMLDLPLNDQFIKKYGGNIKMNAPHITRYQTLSNALRDKTKKSKRTYTLNKAKVRKRIISLCRLERSTRFLAFYSISFPMNASDNSIYEIFNRWLTNCRTRYGLTTYVWVAERQKNGTLHFHILTNNRMEIQTINKAMANSIETSVGQGKLEWGASSATLYNGVDVDSMNRPKKRKYETREQYRNRMKKYSKYTVRERVRFATLYMTKYLTKGEQEFEHLPFHCSRDISQLFNAMVLNDKDVERFMCELSDNPDDYDIRRMENRTHYIYKYIPDDEVFKTLDRLNNIIYEQYRAERDQPRE